MLFEASTLVERLRNATMTACGLVTAVTPLALWIAWSQTSFVIMLASGATAGIVFCVLLGREKTSDTETTRTF